jgi:hypothetical protein
VDFFCPEPNGAGKNQFQKAVPIRIFLMYGGKAVSG